MGSPVNLNMGPRLQQNTSLKESSVEKAKSTSSPEPSNRFQDPVKPKWTHTNNQARNQMVLNLRQPHSQFNDYKTQGPHSHLCAWGNQRNQQQGASPRRNYHVILQQDRKRMAEIASPATALLNQNTTNEKELQSAANMAQNSNSKNVNAGSKTSSPNNQDPEQHLQ